LPHLAGLVETPTTITEFGENRSSAFASRDVSVGTR